MAQINELDNTILAFSIVNGEVQIVFGIGKNSKSMEEVGTWLYNINKGNFSSTVSKVIQEFGKKYGVETQTNEILDTWSEIINRNKIAIKPTDVLKPIQ